MSKLSPAKPQEIIKVLKELGFSKMRQSGSHAVFYHPDGKWTTVPVHKGKEVAKGTLYKILKDAGITYEEYQRLK